MPTSKILLGILVVLPAAVLLAGSTSASEPAANDCKLKPGLPGPPGTHWYYRINRADRRHCWYLGSERQIVSRAHEAVPRDVASRPAPRHEDAAEATAAAPSQAARSASEPALAAAVDVASATTASIAAAIQPPAPDMDFAARWPALPKSVDLSSYGEKSVRLSSYADKEAAAGTAEQIPLRWPVIASRHAEPARSAVGHAGFGSVSLAAALVMVSLLLGGGVLKFARQPRETYLGKHRPADAALPGWLRPARTARAAETGAASAAAERHNGSILRVSMPTDPAQDLKTSLRELMGDLERADAVSDQCRSFAPADRHLRMSPNKPELSKASRFAARKRAAVPTVNSPPLQTGKFA